MVTKRWHSGVGDQRISSGSDDALQAPICCDRYGRAGELITRDGCYSAVEFSRSTWENTAENNASTRSLDFSRYVHVFQHILNDSDSLISEPIIYYHFSGSDTFLITQLSPEMGEERLLLGCVNCFFFVSAQLSK